MPAEGAAQKKVFGQAGEATKTPRLLGGQCENQELRLQCSFFTTFK